MTVRKEKGWFYLDGRIVVATARLLAEFTPGRFAGCGIFETMRAVAGQIFLLDRHLKRFAAGAKTLGIRDVLPSAQTRAVLAELFAKTRCQDARVRLMAWMARQRPHICVAVIPYEPPPEIKFQQGFRAGVYPKATEGRVAPQVKSLDYRSFLEAYRWACRKKFDEALLLDRHGRLSEGSRSNLFIVEEGVLKTPPLSSGCLKGVTRQWVREWARAQAVPFKEEPLPLARLWAAREAFLTNALGGIMPLVTAGGRMVGNGCPGPLTRKVMRAYSGGWRGPSWKSGK